MMVFLWLGNMENSTAKVNDEFTSKKKSKLEGETFVKQLKVTNSTYTKSCVIEYNDSTDSVDFTFKP